MAEIDEFLAKQKNAWSRSTWLNRLSTLFSFAARRGWLSFNPCERIERVTMDVPVATILSVEQAAAVLKFIRKKHARRLAWFSLALLAGVRPEECDRLSWAEVDLEHGTVRMDGAATKTRQRRILTLESNAVEWLRLARKKGAELPLPAVTRRRYLRDLRKHLGFEQWPKDILRKTAASYLMGKYRDAGKVAEVLGNSAGVLLKHYRELVHQDEAERFWAIRPGGSLQTATMKTCNFNAKGAKERKGGESEDGKPQKGTRSHDKEEDGGREIWKRGDGEGGPVRE